MKRTQTHTHTADLDRHFSTKKKERKNFLMKSINDCINIYSCELTTNNNILIENYWLRNLLKNNHFHFFSYFFYIGKCLSVDLVGKQRLVSVWIFFSVNIFGYFCLPLFLSHWFTSFSL